MFQIRGRGAQENPKNRFAQLYVAEPDYDTINYYVEEEQLQRNVETVFLEDNSKSVISTNESEDLGFNYSFNPYKGCEHGCVYCYARPSHEYLGFSAGTDFETKIMIKPDAPALLEKSFKKKSYKPDYIVFSGNTDCYQPIERKLQLTRKSLEVCLKYRNPAAIITKNALVLRDIDFLQEMAKLNLVSVTFSITSLDKELIRKMEPRTSSPGKKLAALKALSEAGIHCGINIAPVIPGLNDEEIPEILKAAAENGAVYAGRLVLRLPYAVKDIFLQWLYKEFPFKAKKVEHKIREMRKGKLNSSKCGERFTGEGEYISNIHNLFELSCSRFNLNKMRFDLNTDLFRRDFNPQMELFYGK
jgi:DNA repair photolyase